MESIALPSAAPLTRVAGVVAAAALLVAAAGATAAPAPLPADVLDRARMLAAHAAGVGAPPAARIEAEAGVLDPRLTLAPCDRIDVFLPAGVPAWGRTRVGLRCTQPGVRWSVLLPMTVRVHAKALVATASLPAGTRLAQDRLTLADTDWGTAAHPPLTDATGLDGRTLLRALAAGQPLRAADLQPRQWFGAGDRVEVVAVGAGYAVSAEGQAVTPGFEGQPARVRIANRDGPPLAGRPVGPRRVEVDL